jgi:hypothetical protein
MQWGSWVFGLFTCFISKTTPNTLMKCCSWGFYNDICPYWTNISHTLQEAQIIFHWFSQNGLLDRRLGCDLKYLCLINLHHLYLILQLQGKVSHYLASQLKIEIVRHMGCCLGGLSELCQKCVTCICKGLKSTISIWNVFHWQMKYANLQRTHLENMCTSTCFNFRWTSSCA